MPPAPPTAAPSKKRRLGELLKDAGLISDLQLNAALQEQKKWGGRLGRTLVEMGFVDEISMMKALSDQLKLPRVDLDRVTLPGSVTQLLRVDVAERYGIFPLAFDSRSKTLQLATSDPTNQDQISELEFRTGNRITVALSTPSSIDRAIRRYYYGETGASSTTTTPQALGVNEAMFGMEELSGPKPANPNAAATPSAAEIQELSARLRQSLEQIASLEQLLATQVRVVRGVVELLVSKGFITREEYLARVRQPPER